ncbi:plastocyanin/azurin family copper-binding protein [Herminiimonas sp. CN]|uniref:cupredoxin domain-containing protein n=1 Tax=Herminiimonas sp. CN TaxID=1349818 RepID=UPI0012DBED2C|nr:cupredoxin family protein [Herminiimonas sp. CN]
MLKILCSLGCAAWLMQAGTALAHGDAESAKMQHAAAPAAGQKPFGIDGDPAKVARVVQIAMTDEMRFIPDAITVASGETVKIVLVNNGRLGHEMVLGTAAELQQHAEMMRKFPAMEHAAPYMAHVSPGGSAEIVWQFNRAGTFDFACLIAGHSEAGMRGRVSVLDAGQKSDNRIQE